MFATVTRRAQWVIQPLVAIGVLLSSLSTLVFLRVAFHNLKTFAAAASAAAGKMITETRGSSSSSSSKLLVCYLLGVVTGLMVSYSSMPGAMQSSVSNMMESSESVSVRTDIDTKKSVSDNMTESGESVPVRTNTDKEKKSFTQLLIESGSDKYDRHHYERYYETWLEPFRCKENLSILEIGAQKGRSLHLWESYFEKPSMIMGLAYNANPEGFEGDEGVKIVEGDQSKNETMDYLNSAGPWDIVIDDGSHVPQHMIFSLFSLWRSVKPGGLYIIEDLETNYWKHGAEIYGYSLQNTGIGAKPEFSAVTKLEQIQQVLVRHEIGAAELSVMPGDNDICSVEWGMNLVVLRKCKDDNSPKPPMQAVSYDEQGMAEWIQEAKRTNPIIKEP